MLNGLFPNAFEDQYFDYELDQYVLDRVQMESIEQSLTSKFSKQPDEQSIIDGVLIKQVLVKNGFNETTVDRMIYNTTKIDLSLIKEVVVGTNSSDYLYING